ncbi:MAG: PEP-CTERM sorting domain-containing protein [Cyanobacteria bacterium SBLK]|nr:PEP-CTERM sorting domain-containing protein [Cyanobacteria bacterium SBLK]
MQKSCFLLNSLFVFSFASLISFQPENASAATINLQNGTATFSQQLFGGPFTPAQAVDGNFGDPNGWAIARSPDVQNSFSETAVWETETDVAAGNLAISMHFLHSNPGHLLGRFRLSVTTDDRSTFADGLGTNGDVTANWSVLDNAIVTGPSGMTFTTLGDDSILAGGTVAATGTYTLNYSTTIDNITGLRLEALEHPTLANNGPGFPGNGNFLLTEITLDATPVQETVPEPAGILSLLVAAGFGVALKNKKRNEVCD